MDDLLQAESQNELDPLPVQIKPDREPSLIGPVGSEGVAEGQEPKLVPTDEQRLLDDGFLEELKQRKATVLESMRCEQAFDRWVEHLLDDNTYLPRVEQLEKKIQSLQEDLDLLKRHRNYAEDKDGTFWSSRKLKHKELVAQRNRIQDLQLKAYAARSQARASDNNGSGSGSGPRVSQEEKLKQSFQVKLFEALRSTMTPEAFNQMLIDNGIDPTQVG
jgi:hypothetical protein